MSSFDTVKKWMKCVCLCVGLIMIASSGYGKQHHSVKKVMSLGTAGIHKKNHAKGRQSAVDNALSAAVGHVVMEMLTSETVIRRFQLINDNILSQKNRYVQNYRVLTESVSGATIRALVQVEVAIDRLSQDLSNLGLARAGFVYPRILFMVAEKNAIDTDFRYWWGDTILRNRTIAEAAIADTLKKSGFHIVPTPDPASPLGLPVNASEVQMIALANQLGADVLIAGSGRASTVQNIGEGNPGAFEAIVEARAFLVKTGNAIGHTRQNKVIPGFDEDKGVQEALAGAGASAGESLSQQIMTAWQRDLNRSAIIAVSVEGTGGHIANFVRLRKTISSLSGVRELKMKAMSADRAEMAVHYQGSAQSLADALLLKAFDGFSINIFEVNPEEIRIRLIHQ